MALLFIDSFDHYTTAQFGDKYTSQIGSTITGGRHGNGAFSPFATIAFPNVASSLAIQGAAIRCVSLPGAQLFEIGRASLSAASDGALVADVFLGDSYRSDPDILRGGQWHYIEWEVGVASDATGSIQAWVDGELVIDEAGIQTNGASGHPYGWDAVVLGGSLGTRPNATFDDYVVLDGSGPAPWNAHLGDKRIGVIRPNGVGDLSEWTPSPVVDNYLNVDDNPGADDDTTRVIAASAGLRDLYHFENVSTDNSLVAYQVLLSAQRSDVGFASLRPIQKMGGDPTLYAGTTRPLGNTYFYRNREIYVLMPDGTAIDDAKMNALQMGAERMA